MAKPSILFLAEPGILGQQCVGRALMMARYLGARLDIVLCADQSGYVPTPERARRDAEQKRQYLESLCKAIVAPDIEISSEMGLGSVDQIVRRASERACEMVVMRCGSSSESSRRELALVRVCPVPLLLTCGRPWHPQPRFAAAIDIVASASQELADSLLRAASGLRLACTAELDLIGVGTGVSERESTGHEAAYVQFVQLGRRYGIHADHIHLLEGARDRALPAVLSKQEYDLLLIAASGPEVVDAASRSTTRSELAAQGGDLLIIPQRGRHAQPAFSNRQRFTWSAAPLWNWLGAD